MFNKIEGRKMATLRDRSGQSYKAPVYLVKIKIEIIINIRMVMTLKEKSKLKCKRARAGSIIKGLE
jgi:hypothetical protein